MENVMMMTALFCWTKNPTEFFSWRSEREFGGSSFAWTWDDPCLCLCISSFTSPCARAVNHSLFPHACRSHHVPTQVRPPPSTPIPPTNPVPAPGNPAPRATTKAPPTPPPQRTAPPPPPPPLKTPPNPPNSPLKETFGPNAQPRSNSKPRAAAAMAQAVYRKNPTRLSTASTRRK